MLPRREFLWGSLVAAVATIGSSAFAAKPSADDVRALLAQRVGSGAQKAGMIAVVIDNHAVHEGGFGSTDVPGVVWNRDTVGQIASITKLLTALVLADMADRGEVAMDDPVTKHLPPSLQLRENGGPITLLDLATYTSGLPNMPGNMPSKWWELPNPYADYTDQKLAEFLSDYVPEYAPGTHYRYANLGFGLLGIALAHRAGKSFEDLLVERICDPLGLDHTRLTLTGDMRRHLAQGHNQDLTPAPLWDMPTLAGGGGMRSNARDLTSFLEAAMGLKRTRLPMGRLLATRRPTIVRGTEAGLGWFISSDQNDEIAWKSGLGGGFASFVGFSTKSRRGAVILSNAYPSIGLGFRLINPAFQAQGDLDSIMR
jgi:CubicO group peptidase (beta-lactamase class C family)